VEVLILRKDFPLPKVATFSINTTFHSPFSFLSTTTFTVFLPSTISTLNLPFSEPYYPKESLSTD